MSYKNELFLIKGRYFTWFGQGGFYALSYYGAVEGSIVVDDSDVVSKYLEPFDVILAFHDGRWGVIPAIEICGFGDAVYASDDGNPFIYDAWAVVRNGDRRTDPSTYEVFILLKKEGLWNAFRLTRGSACCLTEEKGLTSVTPEALIEKLEEKYGIRLHMRKDSDPAIEGGPDSTEFDAENGEAPLEFDVEKDFLQPYDSYYDSYIDDPSMCGNHVQLIQMAIGLEHYFCDNTFLYAIAHGDPYATVLLGRELFLKLREDSEKLKQDDDAFTEEERERHDALLDTCLSYLRLGKKYADEKGNQTMGDIAVAMFEYANAIPRFKVKRVPNKRAPFNAPNKQSPFPVPIKQ